MGFLSTFRYSIMPKEENWDSHKFNVISGNGFAATEKNHEKASRNFESALRTFGFKWRVRGIFRGKKKLAQQKEKACVISLLFLLKADIPAGLGFGQSEYYPYVYYKINIDMVSAASVL